MYYYQFKRLKKFDADILKTSSKKEKTAGAVNFKNESLKSVR
jgi:hypothetical protein